MKKRLFMFFILVFVIFALSACKSEHTIVEIKYSSEKPELSEAALQMEQKASVSLFGDTHAVIAKEDDAGTKNDTSITLGSSAILVRLSDREVMYEKSVYERRAPASLTKMMTALIAMDEADFDSKVTFTDDMKVSNIYAQKTGFETGDVIAFKDIFSSMIVYSGNDSANAVAIAVGGSYSNFAEMMDRKAEELGAVDTHFINPHGLDEDGHYSSAYDLYLIFDECLKHDIYREISSQRNTTFTYLKASEDGAETTKSLDSTDRYLTGIYPLPEGLKVVGGKTGTTDNAGYCLAIAVEDRTGERYIAVLLGCSGYEPLYTEMAQMLSLITK